MKAKQYAKTMPIAKGTAPYTVAVNVARAIEMMYDDACDLIRIRGCRTNSAVASVHKEVERKYHAYLRINDRHPGNLSDKYRNYVLYLHPNLENDLGRLDKLTSVNRPKRKRLTSLEAAAAYANYLLKSLSSDDQD